MCCGLSLDSPVQSSASSAFFACRIVPKRAAVHEQVLLVPDNVAVEGRRRPTVSASASSFGVTATRHPHYIFRRTTAAAWLMWFLSISEDQVVTLPELTTPGCHLNDYLSLCLSTSRSFYADCVSAIIIILHRLWFYIESTRSAVN